MYYLGCLGAWFIEFHWLKVHTGGGEPRLAAVHRHAALLGLVFFAFAADQAGSDRSAASELVLLFASLLLSRLQLLLGAPDKTIIKEKSTRIRP